MKEQQLKSILQTIAAMPGLQGCALVEVDAGMVWHLAGTAPDLQKIAEASSDYWRLYKRQRTHFGGLGELRAQVMMHADSRITMMPCGDDMLLIALSLEKTPVDWAALQAEAQHLKKLFSPR